MGKSKKKRKKKAIQNMTNKLIRLKQLHSFCVSLMRECRPLYSF